MGYYKAINYWVLGGFDGKKSPYEAIDDAKKFGLDGVELTFGDCLEEDITKAECGKIAAYAEKTGVALETLASGFYWGCSLAAEDPSERKRALSFTGKYIETASHLGVGKILIVPGAVDVAWDDSRPVVSYGKVWENSTKSLRQLMTAAERYNVTLCLENVWNKFLLSPMEFKLYLEQFDSEFIGIYFDVGNAVLNGYPEHWIEVLDKKIQAVHFKNFKRNDCGGGLHGFGDSLPDGDVNFEKVLEVLNRISYSGPITAEMIPFSRLPDLVLPDMALAEKTAEDLKRILR